MFTTFATLEQLNNLRIADRLADARHERLADLATAPRRGTCGPRRVTALSVGFTRLLTSIF